MARSRLLLGSALAAGATIFGMSSPALAEQVPVSELTFPAHEPTYDPYGSGTTLWGAVEVKPAGYLSFEGRAVVKTPDRAALNPGTADFSFGARIALTRGVGDWNIMQKGYYNDRQWKLSTHAASDGVQLSCRISGDLGAVHTFTAGVAVPADGSWHRVGCARVGNQVQVRVDGAVVARDSGPIGGVRSTRKYLIGSKGSRQMSDPDQYLGLLDDAWVEVER